MIKVCLAGNVMSPSLVDRLRENLAAVREMVAAAARRSGRPSEAVRLVGVTKYVDPATTRLLAEAGLHDLGESRPQSLWEKASALADLPIRWHLIGHLQRNKIRRTLPLAALIHSGDSLRLLSALDDESRALGRVSEVLLEVNISGDANKHGFAPAEVAPALATIAGLTSLKIRGLMAMASLEGDLFSARRDFAALRELRDSLMHNCPPQVELSDLSMGMSGDFEAAIAEGATIVRVGSALFEGMNAHD